MTESEDIEVGQLWIGDKVVRIVQVTEYSVVFDYDVDGEIKQSYMSKSYMSKIDFLLNHRKLS